MTTCIMSSLSRVYTRQAVVTNIQQFLLAQALRFWFGHTATWHFFCGIFCVLRSRTACCPTLCPRYTRVVCLMSPILCPRTRDFWDVWAGQETSDKQQLLRAASFLTPDPQSASLCTCVLHLHQATMFVYVTCACISACKFIRVYVQNGLYGVRHT